MSKCENEKNIENERKTPDSNILRLGEEREKSLNEDWNMTEGDLKEEKLFPLL